MQALTFKARRWWSKGKKEKKKKEIVLAYLFVGLGLLWERERERANELLKIEGSWTRYKRRLPMREGEFVLSFYTCSYYSKNNNSDISAEFIKFPMAFWNFQWIPKNDGNLLYFFISLQFLTMRELCWKKIHSLYVNEVHFWNVWRWILYMLLLFNWKKEFKYFGRLHKILHSFFKICNGYPNLWEFIHISLLPFIFRPRESYAENFHFLCINEVHFWNI